MTTVALSDLETPIRRRAVAVNSQTVTSAEIDTYANEELQSLYNLMARSWHEYYAGSVAFLVKNNLAYISSGASVLPTTTWSDIISVHVTDANGRRRPVSRFRQVDRDMASGLGGLPDSTAVLRYEWIATQVEFEPVNYGNGLTGTIRYLPQFVPLVRLPLPTDIIIPNGYEQRAILGAAIKCRKKLRVDNADLEAEYASRTQEIEADCMRRNRGGSATLARRARW